MKFYAIRKSDGGVAIMQTVKDDTDPVGEIAKWHPNAQAELASPLTIREIDTADLPDREFRDAWEDDGANITVNPVKAQAIRDARAAAPPTSAEQWEILKAKGVVTDADRAR